MHGTHILLDQLPVHVYVQQYNEEMHIMLEFEHLPII